MLPRSPALMAEAIEVEFARSTLKLCVRPAGRCGRASTQRQPASRLNARPAAASANADVLRNIDQEALEAISEASGSALRAMLAGSEASARSCSQDLHEAQQAVESEGDADASFFLQALQSLLQHREPALAAALRGPYKRAYDSVCNQLAGSEWKVRGLGQPEVVEEPRFSTWEDVNKARRQSHGAASTSGRGPQGTLPGASTAAADLYRVLGVDRQATAPQLKAAYRKQALVLHPDVNSQPDAAARFAALSDAYDVLYDPEARALYDREGQAGLDRRRARGGSRGEHARAAWDEFKPFKRENKHTKARGAAAAAVSSEAAPAGKGGKEREAVFGDVVEYPLREVEIAAERAEGGTRVRGVGLLVGRNKDRGDAKKLPPEQLDLCEIEPLRQQEPGSTSWQPDDLGIPSFGRLRDLIIIPVDAFHQQRDCWVITAPLSPGCEGPSLPEEIIL